MPDARNALAPSGRRKRSPSRRDCILRCEAALAVLAFLFSGCYGDFGRPRPTIFNADRSYRLGAEAAASLAIPPSAYQLTDDESAMRDLAYALIRPPYSRERWIVILGEFYRLGAVPYYGEVYDYAAYAAKLLSLPSRSPTSRYQRLIDDIRNDFERMGQFVPYAARVADMDRKREQSLAYVTAPTVGEIANAQARVAGNAVILAWVQKCLGERAAAYRYVLERLVIASPSDKALEAERLLTELQRRIPAMYVGWGPVVPVAAGK